MGSGDALFMISFNVFIIIALVAVLGGVGLLAWMIDAGVSEKKKTYFQMGLFGLFAGVVGLFFMIEDDSEFAYNYQKPDKTQVIKDKGGMSGADTVIEEGAAPQGGGDIGTGAGDLSTAEGEDDESLAAKGERDCDVCPVVVKIEPGTALLGAAMQHTAGSAVTGPATRKGLSRPYDIGKYEVTVGQFEAFVKETGYTPSTKCRIGKAFVEGADFRSPGFKQNSQHPAVCVSWTDAQHYSEWLSLKAGRVYRLPNEIEWEYAARGGVTSRYLVPAGEITAKDANFAEPNGPRATGTKPVGVFAANANHMHDVHGNAWEFTGDCWSRVYATKEQDKENTGWDCSKRIVKGGAWFSPPERLDLAIRAGVRSDMASNGIGFRVVREAIKPDAAPETNPLGGLAPAPTTDARIEKRMEQAQDLNARAEQFKAELEARGIEPVLTDANGRPTALGRSLSNSGLPAGAAVANSREAEENEQRQSGDAARALGQASRALR